MKSVKVKLNSVDKVQSFNQVVRRFDGDCDLAWGRHVVDAKSIVGIFTLNLAENLLLTINGEGADELIKDIAPFTISA
ncbi:PTS HPr component phosphorylation site [Lachnospiraceae bacterium A10]|jgi:phosphotransferase system HPr-like phosphotransfer protein|nr:PTS HPr component phosphorylation site [Lachnospiraceae bacterium A10]